MIKSYVIPKSRTYSPLSLAENTQEISLSRSYREVWQRATRKIKKQLMIQRLSNLYRSLTNPTGIEAKDVFLAGNMFNYSISTKVDIPLLMFVPYRAFYIIWALSNLISLLYITTYEMYWVTFYEYSPESPEATIEYIIEAFFFLDILVNFNLAYFDHDNKLTTDRKKILKNYLFSTFFIDCFTAFPFKIFSEYSGYESPPKLILFRIIPKCIRWIYIKPKLKCFYFIKKFDKSLAQNKHFYHIVIITSMIILIVHFTACLFFLTAKYEEFKPDTWVVQNDLQGLSEFSQYLTSLYWSILTLGLIGYGEIHPYLPLEIAITMFVMALGLFLLSIVSSIILFAINKLTNSDTAFQDNLDLVDKFAAKTRISIRLIKRLKMCIKNKNLISRQVSIDQIIDPHNMDLRFEIAMDMHNKALTKIPFFDSKDKAFTSHLAFKLILTVYEEGELMWVQGCYSDGIYFVFEGKLKMLHDGTVSHIVHSGDYIGDFEIFLKSERKFDVVCGSITKCMKMTKDCLKEMKTHFPEYFKQMKQKSEERIQNLMDEIALMVSLKLYCSGGIKNHNKAVCLEIKKRMYYHMFAENFHVMENKKILELMHCSREFYSAKKRIKNILRIAMNKYGVKEMREDLDRDSNNEL